MNAKEQIAAEVIAKIYNAIDTLNGPVCNLSLLEARFRINDLRKELCFAIEQAYKE